MPLKRISILLWLIATSSGAPEENVLKSEEKENPTDLSLKSIGLASQNTPMIISGLVAATLFLVLLPSLTCYLLDNCSNDVQKRQVESPPPLPIDFFASQLGVARNIRSNKRRWYTFDLVKSLNRCFILFKVIIFVIIIHNVSCIFEYFNKNLFKGCYVSVKYFTPELLQSH